MSGCKVLCIMIKTDAKTASKGKSNDFETELDKWLEQPARVDGTRFLVNTSRQRLLTKEKLGCSSCHGIVMKELKPGLLVKIGIYALTGHEFYNCPPATRRN